MERINFNFKMDDTTKKLIENTYQRIRNHPILEQWLTKYPKNETEIKANIFKLEKMIQSEEQAALLTSRAMVQSEYYETLDGDFEVIYQKYPFLIEEDLKTKHRTGYLNDDVSLEHLLADVSEIAKKESNDYKQVMAKILNSYKENKGVFLYGSMGIGKTYLLHAFLNYFIKEYNQKVYSIRVNNLILNFANRNKSEEFEQYFNKIVTVPILLIDDIGSEIVDDFGRDTVLFSVLDERLNHKKLTFFTSNHTIENLEAIYKTDKYRTDYSDNAARVIERIRALSVEIQMVGNNRRYK